VKGAPISTCLLNSISPYTAPCTLWQELRRVKGAIPEMVCHPRIAGWSHPRAPSVLSPRLRQGLPHPVRVQPHPTTKEPGVLLRCIRIREGTQRDRCSSEAPQGVRCAWGAWRVITCPRRTLALWLMTANHAACRPLRKHGGV